MTLAPLDPRVYKGKFEIGPMPTPTAVQQVPAWAGFRGLSGDEALRDQAWRLILDYESTVREIANGADEILSMADQLDDEVRGRAVERANALKNWAMSELGEVEKAKQYVSGRVETGGVLYVVIAIGAALAIIKGLDVAKSISNDIVKHRFINALNRLITLAEKGKLTVEQLNDILPKLGVAVRNAGGGGEGDKSDWAKWLLIGLGALIALLIVVLVVRRD